MKSHEKIARINFLKSRVDELKDFAEVIGEKNSRDSSLKIFFKERETIGIELFGTRADFLCEDKIRKICVPRSILPQITEIVLKEMEKVKEELESLLK